MNLSRFFLLLGLSLISANLWGQVQSWLDAELSLSVREPHQIEQTPAVWQQQLGMRFNVSARPRGHQHWQLQYGLRQRAQSQPLMRSGGLTFRWLDVPQHLWQSDDQQWALEQNLDRASVQVWSGAWDWTLGRQPIALGLSQPFSPLDVLQQPQSLDQRYRSGVDAIRWRWSEWGSAEFDAAVLPNAAYLRYETATARNKTELTSILLGSRQAIVGLGLEWYQDHWTLWQEAAGFWAVEESGAAATLGLAYQSLLWDSRVLVHLNTLGSSKQQAQDALWYRQGILTPLGQVYGQLSGGLTDGLRNQYRLSALWHFSNASGLGQAAWERSLSDQSALSLQAQWPWSSATEQQEWLAAIILSLSWVY